MAENMAELQVRRLPVINREAHRRKCLAGRPRDPRLATETARGLHGISQRRGEVLGVGAIAALAADPNTRPGADQPASLTAVERDHQPGFGEVGRGDHPTDQ